MASEARILIVMRLPAYGGVGQIQMWGDLSLLYRVSTGSPQGLHRVSTGGEIVSA